MGDIKALFGLIDKKNKHRLIGAVICCVLSVLCGILPYFGVLGIVTCFLNEQTGNLYRYVCLIAVAIILKHLLFGTGTKISHKVAYQTLGETRKKLFRKIACLPMGYVKTTASGQVKTIIVDNMEQLETFYAHNIPEIISGLAVPLCMEILLVILDVRVAGIMLIPVVLFIIVGVLMIMVQMKKMDEFNQAFADVSVKTVEYINGMKELKIFSADESTYGRLAESIRTYSTVVTEWFQSCLKYVAFNHADLNSNLVFLFPLAGLMYLSGSVTAASFIMYLFMGLAMLIPLETVSNNFDYIGMNASVAKKIDDILKLDEMPDTASHAELPNHTISFEHVTFSYKVNGSEGDRQGEPDRAGRCPGAEDGLGRDNEVILDNYSLKLQPGKITGIHGASGSGKSTLLKLLMRFWDVQDGSVSVDSADVRKIPTKHLRDMESYVTQETHLFHDSIANNIAIAKPGASREEIMEAAKKASIHDFIMTLPKGYDTEVGELGDTLSGGEKQRIGIARAFLHECPLILLDEPTSNLDSLNEGIILKSLKESAEKKTVVLVSHRVSTMNVADVVYEMENGRIS